MIIKMTKSGITYNNCYAVETLLTETLEQNSIGNFLMYMVLCERKEMGELPDWIVLNEDYLNEISDDTIMSALHMGLITIAPSKDGEESWITEIRRMCRFGEN